MVNSVVDPTPFEAYGHKEDVRETQREIRLRNRKAKRETESTQKKVEIVAQNISLEAHSHKNITQEKIINLMPILQDEFNKAENDIIEERILQEDPSTEEISLEVSLEVPEQNLTTEETIQNLIIEEKIEEKIPLENNSSVSTTVAPKVEKDFTQYYANELERLTTIQADQRKLTTKMSKQLKEIAGYQVNFSNDNMMYQAQIKDIEQLPDLRENFKKIRENEQEKFRVLMKNYETFKTLFDNQMKTLEEAKQALLINKGVCNESIIGSWSVWGHKYGANYRIWEMDHKKTYVYYDGSLEERRKKLGIKEGEEISLTAEKVLDSENESYSQDGIRDQIAELSETVDMLKEEVLIYNGLLFNKESYAELVETQAPKNSYVFHKSQLEAYKKKMADLEKLKDSHLQELDKVIETEKGQPTSAQYLYPKQQRIEIATRWEKFKGRCEEIETLLNSRAVYFKLPKDLKIDETCSLPPLDPTPRAALDLAKRITAFKETLALGNNWIEFVHSTEKNSTYLKAVEQVKSFEKEKVEFETQILPAYLKFIENAVSTYKGFMATMQSSKKAIETHLDILTKQRDERATWKVDLVSKV